MLLRMLRFLKNMNFLKGARSSLYFQDFRGIARALIGLTDGATVTQYFLLNEVRSIFPLVKATHTHSSAATASVEHSGS